MFFFTSNVSFHLITPEVDALKDKPWTLDDIWLISCPEEKTFLVKKAPQRQIISGSSTANEPHSTRSIEAGRQLEQISGGFCPFFCRELLT